MYKTSTHLFTSYWKTPYFKHKGTISWNLNLDRSRQVQSTLQSLCFITFLKANMLKIEYNLFYLSRGTLFILLQARTCKSPCRWDNPFLQHTFALIISKNLFMSVWQRYQLRLLCSKYVPVPFIVSQWIPFSTRETLAPAPKQTCSKEALFSKVWVQHTDQHVWRLLLGMYRTDRGVIHVQKCETK